MRYYAAYLARFVSVDPLQFEYPYYTPFQYAGNKPVSYIDLDGGEEKKPSWMKPLPNLGRNNSSGNDRITRMQSATFSTLKNNEAGKDESSYQRSPLGQNEASQKVKSTIEPARSQLQQSIHSGTYANPVRVAVETDYIPRSVAAGVIIAGVINELPYLKDVAPQVAKNIVKSTFISLSINTVFSSYENTFRSGTNTPISVIEKTITNVDVFDAFISTPYLKNISNFTTPLIDVNLNGIKIGGINKNPGAVLLDGVFNKANDKIEHLLPNSNYAKPLMSGIKSLSKSKVKDEDKK